MILNMILILSFTGIMVLMFAVIRRGEKLFEDIRRGASAPAAPEAAGKSTIAEIREERRRIREKRRLERSLRLHHWKERTLDKFHESDTFISHHHDHILIGTASPSRILLGSKNEQHA